ncbi:MAG: sodium:alanine symporter family protein [Deltaproteobacteria bacterium]|nr:sodium:alanine symporter family protein [Deltaproteobacteria bacterium]
MKAIFDLIGAINSFVWGPPMMVLLIGTGIWLTLGTRFVQVRQFGHAWGLTLRGAFRKGDADREEGDITPFQALMTAISATIGNGNIAGVATAIALGGPGAPVWMWLTGLVGMATKYAEALLGVKYREQRPDGTISGGPMYVLKNALGVHWLGHGLGWLFALFGAIAALGIGNMVQANSVALVFRTQMGVPAWITGIVLAVLTWMVIIGGIKRIASVAEVLVPVMCIIYFLGGLVIIIVKIAEIPEAFGLIFKSAFNGHAALGGFAGAGVAQAIRFGVARGIFSNEAGIGSAGIAHGAAQTRSPARQGNIAMLGVFIDTIIINTITTLAIVLTGAWTTDLTSTALTAHAFTKVLGTLGGWIVAFGSVTFGYSTLLTWSYYGLKCTDYLFGIRVSFHYRWFWCLVIIVGALFSGDVTGIKFIWDIADTLNGAMAIPNLIGLIWLSRILFRETSAYTGSSASEG